MEPPWMLSPRPLGRFCFLNAPFNTEFLGYGGEPTSLLYALAVLVDDVRHGRLGSVGLDDISVISFRSAAEMDIAALQQSVEASPPRVLGISNMTPSSQIAREIVRAVRAVEPDVVTIFGGPHEDELTEAIPRLGTRPLTRPTALTHPQLADFSVSGDGEYALSFLVREIEAAGRDATRDRIKATVLAKRAEIQRLPGIGGISFVYGGDEHTLRLSNVALNLDALPLMPRDLLDDAHSRCFSIFRGRGQNLRTAQVMTSRGCFWACAFCTEATGATSQRSFANVRRELETLRPLGYEALFFDDSTFTNLVEATNRRGQEGVARRAFLGELLAYLRDARWNWGCETRIDQVDESVLADLKAAGCSYVYFGVESVIDRMLRDMHKGQRRNRVESTLDAVEQIGMRIGLSLMFCAPNMAHDLTHESSENLEYTVKFFKERVSRGSISIVSTNIATYYPGSEMTHRALANGVELDFTHPTPNVGYPWTRFEDGQGYHPPNVSRPFVEEIATLTARRLAPYLLKGNVAAVDDERLGEAPRRNTDLLNLNYPVEFSGSAASRLDWSRVVSTEYTPPQRDDILIRGRVLLGALCGLEPRDAEQSVALARTPDEAVALALALSGYYDTKFNAIVPDIDLTTVATPFQFSGDHGDVCGEGLRSRAFRALPLAYQVAPRRPRCRTAGTVKLLDPFERDYELFERIKREWSDSLDVILLPHVDPSTGRVLDIRMLCHELRAEKDGEQLLIIVDGRHAGGALCTDWSVRDVDCDFYVASPLESLALLGCCGLVVGSRRTDVNAHRVHEWIPIEDGMLPPGMTRETHAGPAFPTVLVDSLLASLGGISGEDIKSCLEAIARHRRHMKSQFSALLSDACRVQIVSPTGQAYLDGLLSCRFECVDQFGLVEHLWREQQVLASYFCANDVVRFAMDMTTTTEDLRKAATRLSALVARFRL